MNPETDLGIKYKVLNELLPGMLSSRTPSQLLTHVFDCVSRYFNLDLLLNYWVEERFPYRLQLIHHRGVTSAEAEALLSLDQGQTICGAVVKSKQPYVCERLQETTDFQGRILRQMGLRRYACFPLVLPSEDRPFALGFGSHGSDVFEPAELEILHLIASQLVHAFDRIGRLEELERQNSALFETNRFLSSSENRFAAIFAASPHPMLITTLENHEVIEANDAFLLLLGITRRDMDLRYGELIRGNELMLQIPEPDETSTVPEGISREVTFTNHAGEEKVCILRTVRLDFNGELLLLTMISDLTEHKQYEHELQRLSQLHLVGEVAAGIGHEVRNPMTTVRGFLQLMLMQGKNTLEPAYLQVMIEELDRANQIITEFLSLAKDHMVQLKRENLNDLIRKIMPLIEADASVTGKMITTHLTPIEPIEMDSKQITQLILNFVRNALEATGESGWIQLKTYMQDDRAVLVIEDNGPGIATDVVEQIWKPFYTTKENGSGLGLAICFSIANKHGASIDLSTGKEGTAFYVRFRTN
ncbi:ATP-binding protein [Saccharibacillus alkalitolerans]|uniref:histidine kinase n=1 Tax=Saccharibacillus alkalitolerans TaxID=2705290 RepID=A0ABX0F8M8_9BACL|nr:ATP-binding protein [Saccharibacillus alkalitolerans]NGZ77303.1 GAF domain-containing protein [Saccharibacillus alkalitolerans]